MLPCGGTVARCASSSDRCRKVGTFVSVAVRTAQREVPDVRRPTVLTGDDVIDVKRDGIETSGHSAILATVPSPQPDPALEVPPHEAFCRDGLVPSSFRNLPAR